jgi:major membrane immunogen (membrane-anchored lipoprotein)
MAKPSLPRPFSGPAIPLLPLLAFLALLLCPACQKEAGTGLYDGYYTAESLDYNNRGWKEFLTIYVSQGRITSAEFNGKNQSGFLRSWDMDYILFMSASHGLKPNKYPRSYVNSLITLQDPDKIQALTGGRRMHATFVTLAQAALEQSRLGAREVAFIDIPPSEFPDDV